jgi:hypothetical protein
MSLITNDLVDQMMRQQVLTHADLTSHPRGWNLGSTLSEYSYHPFATLPKSFKKDLHLRNVDG